MKTKLEIAKNWLPRYTGTPIDEFGDYLLLTNFNNYVTKFAETFNCDINGIGKPMQSATNSNGLSIINFGMGSSMAATIMDILVASNPKGVLFLGKWFTDKVNALEQFQRDTLVELVKDGTAT